MVNTRKAVAVAAKSVGAGAAAAGIYQAAYRATHPRDARRPDADRGDRGRRRPWLDDALFAMPEVVHHELAARDGGIIHAAERGSGRPLVLLHGITLRHDVWAPQFNQLSDRFRVIAVDLRGHGTSKAGSEGFGMRCLAADLADLLVGLDLHDAIVVGHSMGGMTAMQFCGDFPEVLAERVAGLVFLATRAHRVVPPFAKGAARSLVAQGQHRVDAGRELPARASTSSRVVRSAFGDQPSPKAVRIVAEMGRSMSPEDLLPSVAGLLKHDARRALQSTHTPSMVVVGTRDLLTPVPAGRHLAHLLPDADFVVLDRAGHQLMQERPDELAELLDAFAARLDGSTASVSDAVATDDGPVQPAQVEHLPD